MGVRADILEISRILEEASRCRDLARFEPPSPLGDDAEVYSAMLRKLPGQKDVPSALAAANFRPLFLVNGLIVAASLRRAPRALLLQALSTGLHEFADYFELIADRFEGKTPPLSPEQAEAAQKRYFAYCVVQLVECGLPLSGAFATMKGDSFDQRTAYELRAWIEEGPKRMLGSSLLSERERELWSDLFKNGRAGWPALRDHLVVIYSLPFRPIPGR